MEIVYNNLNTIENQIIFRYNDTYHGEKRGHLCTSGAGTTENGGGNDEKEMGFRNTAGVEAVKYSKSDLSLNVSYYSSRRWYFDEYCI